MEKNTPPNGKEGDASKCPFLGGTLKESAGGGTFESRLVAESAKAEYFTPAFFFV